MGSQLEEELKGDPLAHIKYNRSDMKMVSLYNGMVEPERLSEADFTWGPERSRDIARHS